LKIEENVTSGTFRGMDVIEVDEPAGLLALVIEVDEPAGLLALVKKFDLCGYP